MNRIEMKQTARETLRQKRIEAILGLVLPVVVVGAIFGGLSGLLAATENTLIAIFIALFTIALIPLNVGVFYFFRKLLIVEGPADYMDLLKGHKENFLRNLGYLVLMQIFITLWTFLLIIPGIIKMFSYIMTPYILGDDDLKKGPGEADPITISRVMMDGHKLEYFVMILSFIGWLILGALTFNILTVIFVAPYMQLTFAKFYETRKAELDRKYFVNP